MNKQAQPPHIIMPQPIGSAQPMHLTHKDAKVEFLKELWSTSPGTEEYKNKILNSFGYQKLFDLSKPVKMISMEHFRVLNDKAIVNRITRREWENKETMASRYLGREFIVKYNILGEFEVETHGGIKFANSVICFEPNR